MIKHMVIDDQLPNKSLDSKKEEEMKEDGKRKNEDQEMSEKGKLKVGIKKKSGLRQLLIALKTSKLKNSSRSYGPLTKNQA